MDVQKMQELANEIEKDYKEFVKRIYEKYQPQVNGEIDLTVISDYVQAHSHEGLKYILTGLKTRVRLTHDRREVVVGDM